ncbi:transposase [Candidatus Microgenomates bacterium]|nr:transposase [Candidatus Microgenomates bacterium]
MATPARYFQEGFFYHVYNRGNRKQKIFLQYRDYERFLKRLKEYKAEFGISILCYCLMPNHFHFLLRQDTEIPLTAFMLRLGTSYAKYFNIKYEEVGSLFQDRFRAKLVETDEYLLQLSRYIHRNPKDILPSTPGVELRDYRWSSYPAYVNGSADELVDPNFILSYFAKNNPTGDYQSFVEHEFEEKNLLSIKDFLLEDI